MLVLKQLVIVGSGCGLGVLVAGTYLTASAPAATRSLDYLLTAMVFLIGFAAGTWLAGGFTARTAAFQAEAVSPDPNRDQESETLGELAPLRAPVLGHSMTKIR